MRLIRGDDIPLLLPMTDAVDLMGEAFAQISAGLPRVAGRQAMPIETGTGLLMGAAARGRGIAMKLVGVMPGNRQMGLPGSIGMVLLLDDETAQPLALIDGTMLTAWRTAALNAFAIRLLSLPGAEVAVLVGCGAQAVSQVTGLLAVRSIGEIRVLGRTLESARAFAARQDVACRLRPTDDAATALADAQVVICATDSLAPVIPGAAVEAGCHVSGIGSFRPDMRELDTDLLRKASIYVESRETALEEAGELIDAHRQGFSPQSSWAEIGEVLSGERAGRQSDDQVSFFKSVGHAVFDLLTARALYDAAEASDLGATWSP